MLKRFADGTTRATSDVGSRFYSDTWFRVAAAAVAVCAYIPHYVATHGIQVPVGVYVVALGGLAAAVTLRKEPSTREKALWIIAITILMVAEIQNLYVEADRQHKEAKVISDSLEATKKGLGKTLDGLTDVVGQLDGISGDIDTATKNSQTQFGKTMSQFNDVTKSQEAIAATTKENLDQITGGDQYFYVTAFPALDWGNPPTWPPHGIKDTYTLTLRNSGEIPFYHVDIRIHCCPGKLSR